MKKIYISCIGLCFGMVGTVSALISLHREDTNFWLFMTILNTVFFATILAATIINTKNYKGV